VLCFIHACESEITVQRLICCVQDIDAELQALGLDPNVIGAEGQSHGTGPSE